MVIENKYEISQQVYVITDGDQKLHIITGILVRPTGIAYELSGNGACRWYYDFEISEEMNQVTKVTR